MVFIKKLKEKTGDPKGGNPVVGPPPTGDALEGLVEQMIMANGKRRTLKDKFDATIPSGCFLAEYSQDDLVAVVDDIQTCIEYLEENGKTKHLANRTLFIFDDMVGSALFSSTRCNPFKKLNTNHRHSSASILMVSQGYREIPKTVRGQFSCLILFQIFNEKELEAIMEEFPMDLHAKQWMEIYKFATDGDHNFLFYNMQKPKARRIMKNFDQVLTFQNKRKDRDEPRQRGSLEDVLPPPYSAKK